ncbi:MAG: sugar kinase [Alphaproteobacteria bacterium]|nr:sugar kinase [Alphaproteobacteria bacterium]
MGRNHPRGVAVIDAGSTNTKLFLFGPELDLLAEETAPSVHPHGPPYRWIDPAPVLGLIQAGLARFDRIAPVDMVIPCAHGSALALLDADGDLALPIMDYEAEPPTDIVEGYANLAPDFSEVFAPTNPGGLTLGRQLYWQETAFPDAFASVRTILPWGQYIAYRLTGVARSEVSALGAQTHLWDVTENRFSSLAQARGWADRFAPIAPAWKTLGTLNPPVAGADFTGEARVVTGIHDSNANLLRFMAGGVAGFTLLSTGTWIIGFDTDADIRGLDPRYDLVSNTTIFGAPIASCRFMGGREFGLIAEGETAAQASLGAVEELIGRGVFALPSFTDSGGPAPGTGGQGRIIGAEGFAPGDRASLAALYCALMSAESLRALGTDCPVIVDGPFAENPTYLACLAGLIPDRCVKALSAVGGSVAGLAQGSAEGAALLALIVPDGALPHRALNLSEIAPPNLPNLAAYQAAWRSRAGLTP